MMMERILKNIDTCAKHKISVIVVHAPRKLPEASVNDYSKRRYSQIGICANVKEVTIAFENAAYNAYVEYTMNLAPGSKFCWDCGYENCKPTYREFAIKAKKPLKELLKW